MTVLDAGLYMGNSRQSANFGGLKVSYTTYRHDDSFEIMHAHANPHFSLVLSGGNLEKRKNKELQRLPGKLTFYHSGEYHQNLYTGQGSAHLNVELLPEFFTLREIKEIELSPIADEPASKFLFLKLYKELLIHDDVSELNSESLLIGLVQNGRACSGRKPVWVEKLDEFLKFNLDKTLSLSLLSAEVGVHPVTISKHFPKYFSCTVGEYIRKLRTERALELIRTSSLPLTMVGACCGFADQSHFIRTFKHYTGFLPNELRKAQ